MLLGNGDGTFQPQVTYAVGLRRQTRSWRATSPATADRPGRREHGYIPTNTVSVLLGNGDGTFQPQVTYAVGSDPDAIVAGDFTRRRPTPTWPSQTGYDNTVSVLLGNGDGTFQPQVTYAVGSYPNAIVAGDFTGDGRTDLAVANSY